VHGDQQESHVQSKLMSLLWSLLDYFHDSLLSPLHPFCVQRAARGGAAHPAVGPVPVHGGGRGAPGARVAGRRDRRGGKWGSRARVHVEI
jgi:hypothetical protein